VAYGLLRMTCCLGSNQKSKIRNRKLRRYLLPIPGLSGYLQKKVTLNLPKTYLAALCVWRLKLATPNLTGLRPLVAVRLEL
jgi:hypothetical protein